MFFSQTVLISVLGLSALSIAVPIENGVASEAAPAAPCTWYDNLLGRDCDDDDAPSPRPAWWNPFAPKPANNNNPFASQPQPYPNQPSPIQPYPYQPNQNHPAPSQPYPNQPVSPIQGTSNPRPANGFQPRPVGAPRPITNPKGDGSDKEGQSSWCNRPDPSRRPASCPNGGTLPGTSPRNVLNKPNENDNKNQGDARPAWQQVASPKGSGGPSSLGSGLLGSVLGSGSQGSGSKGSGSRGSGSRGSGSRGGDEDSKDKDEED
ncbi:hypothetical protein E2P81_ATG09315 [Venturia nashicola]|uniref:Uncharacterized protein n=1 Tax=Venturia nashicola TaxID=86259 RepID=A0A4Z1P4J7_9PEZI|nr:hypothetical protein E6O75_ATG09522 [Venturia nashicola]TLD25658.1 hypothetical protein E2P81_ATG09315 [Venturia nashicola]